MTASARYNSPYSPHKIIHHPEKIKTLKGGGQTVPLQVQLIISDLCNQDCSFCAYRMSGYTSNQLFAIIGEDGVANNNPNRMIPYDKCLEIIDDCEELGVKALQITGGGEPTVHPQHPEIFHYAQDHGLELGLVTNGARLKSSMEESLRRSLFKWIRVSIDAGKAETYGSIRRVQPEVFYRVQENIKKVVNCKKDNSDLIVGTGFVVTKENYSEIVDWVKIAKDLGVDNVRISAVFTNEGIKYFEGFWKQANHLAHLAEEYNDNNFTVFNNFDDRSDDLQDGSPDYEFCGYQHLNTYIGGDLNIYRCCVLAYNERGKIGSIKDQRFKDFWNSDEKFQAMKNFNATGCPRCMFNNKNKQILYAISKKPRHVNFV